MGCPDQSAGVKKGGNINGTFFRGMKIDKPGAQTQRSALWSGSTAQKLEAGWAGDHLPPNEPSGTTAPADKAAHYLPRLLLQLFYNRHCCPSLRHCSEPSLSHEATAETRYLPQPALHCQQEKSKAMLERATKLPLSSHLDANKHRFFPQLAGTNDSERAAGRSPEPIPMLGSPLPARTHPAVLPQLRGELPTLREVHHHIRTHPSPCQDKTCLGQNRGVGHMMSIGRLQTPTAVPRVRAGGTAQPVTHPTRHLQE